MRHFELLAGKHTNEDKKEYKKGDIVPSQGDLVAAFGDNKFKEVTVAPHVHAHAPKGPETPTKGAAVKTAGSDDGKGEPPKTDEGALGVDHTGDFDEAIAAELKVYKKGTGYFVAAPDAPGTALNEKPLKLKEVEPYITKLLAKGK